MRVMGKKHAPAFFFNKLKISKLLPRKHDAIRPKFSCAIDPDFNKGFMFYGSTFAKPCCISCQIPSMRQTLTLLGHGYAAPGWIC
jgi:hypothetical protein